VRNVVGELINTASSTVVFIDNVTRRPMRAPDFFVDKLKTYFEDEN
jgi:acyl-CoA thioesterase FadM